MQSLLELSSPEVTKYFTKVFVNPQGQLCLRLNRPIIFTESLVRVMREGPEYGHTHRLTSSLEVAQGVSGESFHEKTILLLNDMLVLRNAGTSVGGCDITVSKGRSLLLVGVLTNLLRATGFKVHQHQCNTALSSYVSHRNPSCPKIPKHSFFSNNLLLAVNINWLFGSLK